MSLRTASCILSALPVLAAAAAAGDVLAPMKLASTTPAGVSGNDWSQEPALSHDGRYVAFYSRASDLLPGDTNATWDVFLRDNSTGTIPACLRRATASTSRRKRRSAPGK